MREILFRGKSVYNDEWVYGFYYKAKMFRTDTELCDFISVPHPDEYGRPSEHWMVEPETVGQFTGLYDENGTRIFEGDIVKANFTTNHSKQILRVICDDGSFFFDNGCVQVTRGFVYNINVIGNIHDNPELLEKGE